MNLGAYVRTSFKPIGFLVGVGADAVSAGRTAKSQYFSVRSQLRRERRRTEDLRAAGIEEGVRGSPLDFLANHKPSFGSLWRSSYIGLREQRKKPSEP